MNIVFVGSSGVPNMGTASDTRLAFFANLLSKDHSVTIINRYASKSQLNTGNIELKEGVVVKDIIKSRDSKKIVSVVLLLLSIALDPFCLLSLNRKRHIDILHVYSGHFLDFVLYWLVSRIIGAKIIYQFVEYRSEIDRGGFYHKLNGYLCDFKGAKLWDGAISISTFLQNKANEVNSNLKQIKITPLCDFSIFDSVRLKKKSEKPYLLFCGSVRYKEPLELIIVSYRKSQIHNSHNLVLILSGPASDLNCLKSNYPEFTIESRLPYNDLIEYYKGASVLLIPLRNTIQDIARFPNKVCEYIASSGAILTTNYGEIKYYFKDGENAIVADEFNVDSYSKKMDEIATGSYNLEKIKYNAYNTGLEFFSIDAYRKSLNNFLKEIVG